MLITNESTEVIRMAGAMTRTMTWILKATGENHVAAVAATKAKLNQVNKGSDIHCFTIDENS